MLSVWNCSRVYLYMRTYSTLGCECFATKEASIWHAVYLKLLSCVFIHAHLFNPPLWMFCHKRGIDKAAVCLKLVVWVFIHAHLFYPRLWMFCHKRCIHKACCLFEIALMCIYTCTLIESSAVNIFPTKEASISPRTHRYTHRQNTALCI